MEGRLQTWLDAVKWDDKGLVAAIAQDVTTLEVLMLAWMNRDSLQRTLDTGDAHYWSRSRQALWKKGETSGHIQHVKELRLDCDGDAILIKVEQVGNVACHTGRRRCFFNLLEDGRWVVSDATAASGSVLASSGKFHP
ncbi:MAG: phosphoribosyl-AMP cyclohydrolase [Burkholderiales bacterium]|nr:phosphoribosyl-AMP cyclohydrolase [Burkholderiales bacterium]